MLILAIETSCDETSISVVSAKKENSSIKILSNIVSSQIKLHAKWGGVVPNLAAREHLKNIQPVFVEALNKSNCTLAGIDLICVTQGPGLIPALLIGLNFAKSLSYFTQKPLLGINHIEGHLYSVFTKKSKPKFPIITLTASGGHTQLILIKKHFEYQIIGQTLDDAVGEAFDKVAKILELGYPGGPIVSKFADQFNPNQIPKSLNYLIEKIKLPRPMINSGNFDLSFSGIKTAVLYLWQKLQKEECIKDSSLLIKKAICYEFQTAIIETLSAKAEKAIKTYSPKSLVLVGGVSANQSLRKKFYELALENNIIFHSPDISLCGDNASMIAIAGFYRYHHDLKQKKLAQKNWRLLEAQSNLKLVSY